MVRTVVLLSCSVVMLCACKPQLPQEPGRMEVEAKQSAAIESSATNPFSASLVKDKPVKIENLARVNEDCNIEAVNDTLFDGKPVLLSMSQRHDIKGWLVDPLEKSTGKKLRLVLAEVGNTAEVWTTESVNRISRTDVAQVRAYPSTLTDSGFSFEVDLRMLAPGDYHVYVLLINADAAAVCDPGRQIRITP